MSNEVTPYEWGRRIRAAFPNDPATQSAVGSVIWWDYGTDEKATRHLGAWREFYTEFVRDWRTAGAWLSKKEMVAALKAVKRDKAWRRVYFPPGRSQNW